MKKHRKHRPMPSSVVGNNQIDRYGAAIEVLLGKTTNSWWTWANCYSNKLN